MLDSFGTMPFVADARLGRMSFNANAADNNGNKEKWQQMKEQTEKIDQLIRDVAATMVLESK